MQLRCGPSAESEEAHSDDRRDARSRRDHASEGRVEDRLVDQADHVEDVEHDEYQQSDEQRSPGLEARGPPERVDRPGLDEIHEDDDCHLTPFEGILLADHQRNPDETEGSDEIDIRQRERHDEPISSIFSQTTVGRLLTRKVRCVFLYTQDEEQKHSYPMHLIFSLWLFACQLALRTELWSPNNTIISQYVA